MEASDAYGFFRRHVEPRPGEEARLERCEVVTVGGAEAHLGVRRQVLSCEGALVVVGGDEVAGASRVEDVLEHPEPPVTLAAQVELAGAGRRRVPTPDGVGDVGASEQPDRHRRAHGQGPQVEAALRPSLLHDATQVGQPAGQRQSGGVLTFEMQAQLGIAERPLQHGPLLIGGEALEDRPYDAVSLGDSPTPTTSTATEVYTGIQQGTMKAVSFPFTYAHVAYKIHEVADWYTANLAPGTSDCPVVLSGSAYKKLPAQYKKLLDSVKDEVIKTQIAAYQNIDKKNLPMLKSKLKEVRYTEAQIATFRKAAGRPVIEAWIKQNQSRFDARGLVKLIFATVGQKYE